MATPEQQRNEATSKATQEQQRNEPGTQSMQRGRSTSAPVRRQSYPATGPFSLMRRFSEDMDLLFSGFFGPSMFQAEDWPGRLTETTWWPEIDVSHAGNKLVIQADVPGLKREDVKVEVRDNELCISGERRSESEQTEGRYYRSERSYGSFCRSIALPEGAKPETASATFEDGVLKVEMEAPSTEQGRGRRIEVREGRPH